MKLGFFTMPMHPIGKDWQQSLREDREAFILADELGFVEGYCGEHGTDPEENITSSAMFMATLVDATKRMKLGTGTLNMPNHHPAAVAGEIAMLDHLLGGRFILGVSPGALPSDAEVFGNMDMNRPAMFLEAINQVLQTQATLVERARTEAGNLAHALKTPLAVLDQLAQSAPAGSDWAPVVKASGARID